VRKRQPNDLVVRFTDDLDLSLSDWRDLTADVPAVLARRATMDAFARAAVAFERFRSDWHVAAVTRDASAFRLGRQARVVDVLSKGEAKELLGYVQVFLPTHLTLEQVSGLLDPAGGNVSIPSIKRWQEMARRDLASPYRDKVEGIPFKLKAVASAVIAIRNGVSHQSPRSLSDMNGALGCLTHPSHDGLRRPTNQVTLFGIPAYLHGRIAGGETRVERYHAVLGDLAKLMRVPSVPTPSGRPLVRVSGAAGGCGPPRR